MDRQRKTQRRLKQQHVLWFYNCKTGRESLISYVRDMQRPWYACRYTVEVRRVRHPLSGVRSYLVIVQRRKK